MHRRLDVLNNKSFPAYVVWELTLRCDQRCTHCGSRAALPRPNELTLEQALLVIKDLIALRTREVILIGGEAYLHEGFFEIIKALRAGGIEVGLTTGGRGIDLELAFALKAAGINRVSVSIDGLEIIHDMLRANKNSFKNALNALKNLKQAHIRPAVNTTINRLNKAQLEELYDFLKLQNITSWQVQILAPLGRAADRPDMLLQPYDLLDIIPRLALIKKRALEDNILIMSGNNLGYFGPDEALLRSLDGKTGDYFAGCQAGRYILGIESDGTIKGCPSLQTYYYAAGSVKEKSLTEIWQSSEELLSLRSKTKNTKKELWGFCKTCDYAEVCQGGCTFTAHALFGKAGNNPYCFYRAQVLARKGVRERLVRTHPALNKPFDHALFRLQVEDYNAPEPAEPSVGQMLRIRRNKEQA